MTERYHYEYYDRREKYVRENVGPAKIKGGKMWAPYHRTRDEAVAAFDRWWEWCVERPIFEELERRQGREKRIRDAAVLKELGLD